MDLIEFKRKLDNREFWGENSKEMWDAAYVWQEQVNREDALIKWSWDCGLKLDYDGGLLSIESRFYPPHKNSECIWDGTLTVNLFGKPIMEKEFKNKTLDGLKKDVEDFVEHYKGIAKSRLII